MKNLETELWYNQINQLLENTLNKLWEKFVCDEVLLVEIESYKKSDWLLKKWYKSQILTWFLSRRNENLNVPDEKWAEQYKEFMSCLENNKTSDDGLFENLSLNLFRNKENLKKLNYIKENSDITDDIILIAKNLSTNNRYHNFWHEIWVAETVIKLCKKENVDRRTLNLLVLSALFHDWWYTLQNEIDLEKLACNLCDTYIPNNIFENLNITRDELNNLIKMTKLSNRNTNNDEFVKILQDSDLWCLWYWPYYILYSCMWMIDEWIISLDNFVEDEKKFIKNNIIDWKLFMSKVWNETLKDPLESLEIIKWRPKAVIEKAYKLRNEDITFDEFKDKIDSIITN